MPRTKSAKKALRQTKHRTEQNRSQRSRVRSAVKAVRVAQTAEGRKAALASAERVLDRAGRKGLIHPNAAARLKRRLSKAVSTAG